MRACLSPCLLGSRTRPGMATSRTPLQHLRPCRTEQCVEYTEDLQGRVHTPPPALCCCTPLPRTGAGWGSQVDSSIRSGRRLRSQGALASHLVLDRRSPRHSSDRQRNRRPGWSAQFVCKPCRLDMGCTGRRKSSQQPYCTCHVGKLPSAKCQLRSSTPAGTAHHPLCPGAR